MIGGDYVARNYHAAAVDGRIVQIATQGGAVASTDFARLMGLAQDFHRATGGAFDVTVQPLWALYRDHFSQPDPDPAGPPADRVREAARVGADRMVVGPDRIVLPRGMAGCPGPLKIESAQMAGHVHYLADYIKPGCFLGFHGCRGKLIGVDASRGHLGGPIPFRADRMKRPAP